MLFLYNHEDKKGKGYVAKCGDVSVGPTFHSPLCKLARALIEDNPANAEQPWQLIRAGMIALEGEKLANLAAMEVSEDGEAVFRPYRADRYAT